MMSLLPPTDSTMAPLAESLDTAANIAATAGMLQKLNGLSLTEKKEQKASEKKEPKESKAKAKQEKGESASTTKKSTPKKSFGKTQSTLSTTPAGGKLTSSTSIMATQSPTSASSPAESPKISFKTERDGDSVMSLASEQPTPKKRRIQPTFVSALPGSTSPAVPVVITSTPAPAPSPLPVLTSADFARPSSSSLSSNVSSTPKPKKRIQPTFVSALPGH